MIQKLVWENVRHRPLRTLLSALLIAIPVTLVLTLVGLSRGMLEDHRRRTQGVGADVLVRPKGASFMSGTTSAPIPEAMIAFLEKQPHVKLATGIVVQPLSGPFSTAAGIDLEKFTRMNGGFRFLSGGPFQQKDDVIVDQYFAQEQKVRAGDTITLMNRQWTVRGIVEPGVLNRVFMDLRHLQDLTGNTGKLGQIYLKLDAPENTDTVIASLKTLLEDYPIWSMKELATLYTMDNVPALRSFINVMIGIAMVIGFAVVCLSMYMAVLQRTREVGILKSLGASRAFILGMILREAVLLAAVGTVLGIGLTFAGNWLLATLAPSSFPPSTVPDWWPMALLISLGGAVLGALYPGMRAASQDPIEALAYE
ncbi:MAG: ABC transporter permease [Bryobacterales bacterium]|nr:ABC transporter permease [Bryobacterales bacterium]